MLVRILENFGNTSLELRLVDKQVGQLNEMFAFKV